MRCDEQDQVPATDLPATGTAVGHLCTDRPVGSAPDLDQALERGAGAAASVFILRFAGASAERALPVRFMAAALGAFREEIAVALPASSPVDLDLVDICADGTVVCFGPPPAAHSARDAGEHSAPPVPDRADHAARMIVALHRAAEEQRDLRGWAARPLLVRAFAQLCEVLESCGVDLDVVWCPSTGTVRRASLTRTGRAHVGSYLWRHATIETRRLVGTVVAVDSDGSFVLDRGTAPGRSRVVIAADRCAGQDLVVGGPVAVVATRMVVRTDLGLTWRGRYQFDGFAV